MLQVQVTLPLGAFTLDVATDFALSGLTALFGRSGSGKSTLLRVIAGLETRARGRVVLGSTVWQDKGTLVPAHRRGVGYVFQDTRLFPHLSVEGNLRFALDRAQGLGGPGLAEVVSALDLAPLLARRTMQLSGGERQRVAIGRALLTAPQILLMDEPLAALDDMRKAEILPYLERLRDAGAVPILYVSHSVAEVARLANRIVLIDDGRITASGPASALLSDPAIAPALGLREAGAILTARVSAHEADGLTRLDSRAGPLWLPQIAAPPGSQVRLRILAQDVMLATRRPEAISALNILPATVIDLRLGSGPGALVQLAAGGEMLLARITRRSAAALGLAPGLEVFAVLKAVSVAQENVGGRE